MAIRFIVAREFNRFPWELDEAPFDELIEIVRLMGYLPREPSVVIAR